MKQLLIIGLLTLTTACGGGGDSGSSNTKESVEKPPVTPTPIEAVDDGASVLSCEFADIYILGNDVIPDDSVVEITLNNENVAYGTFSIIDNTYIHYQPDVTKGCFVGIEETTYTVSDSDSQATATISVELKNRKPVITEVVNEEYALINEPFVFDITSSTDDFPDVDELNQWLTYEWVVVNKPEKSELTNGFSESNELEVVFDVAGIYKVEFVSNDGELDSEVFTVEVEVIAPVIITENISIDTIWGESNKYYLIENDIQIRKDTSLTIKEGVIIIGSQKPSGTFQYLHKSIQGFGNITVNGSQSEPVMFDNVYINQGEVDNGEPYNTIKIDYAIFRNGGILSDVPNGSSGKFELSNSVMTSNKLTVWLHASDAGIKFENNIFTDVSFSIWLGDANVIIRNNLITNASFSLWVGPDWGDNGILYLNKNTFENVELKLLTTFSASKIDATNNYWSTTNPDLIDEMIWDENDDFELDGYIEYNPILLEPNPDTPVPVENN